MKKKLHTFAQYPATRESLYWAWNRWREHRSLPSRNLWWTPLRAEILSSEVTGSRAVEECRRERIRWLVRASNEILRKRRWWPRPGRNAEINVYQSQVCLAMMVIAKIECLVCVAHRCFDCVDINLHSNPMRRRMTWVYIIANVLGPSFVWKGSHVLFLLNIYYNSDYPHLTDEEMNS